MTTAKINNQAVTNAKIANGAINHLKISTGGVATTNIEDEAVTTVKIADGQVTDGKLAGSINYNKIDASTIPAVTSLSQIESMSVKTGVFPASSAYLSVGDVYYDYTGVLKVKLS